MSHSSFKFYPKCKLKLVYIYLFFYTNSLLSQNINQSLIWYGVFTTHEFNTKWYFQNEFQERHFIFPNAQHQFLIRSHFHRVFPQTGYEISAGGSYFLTNSSNPTSKINIAIPERRPHIEIGKKHSINKIQFEHRFRSEARFYRETNLDKTELKEGYYFDNFRFRFRSQITLPLFRIKNQSTVKLKLSDEIHFHSTNNKTSSYFDQNRVYIALNFVLNENANIEMGYLNWYQQKNSTQFYNRDIARFTLFHKI